ncbi:hypothetical protein STEG23_012062, partial [Scotinomys teguina]
PPLPYTFLIPRTFLKEAEEEQRKSQLMGYAEHTAHCDGRGHGEIRMESICDVPTNTATLSTSSDPSRLVRKVVTTVVP